MKSIRYGIIALLCVTYFQFSVSSAQAVMQCACPAVANVCPVNFTKQSNPSCNGGVTCCMDDGQPAPAPEDSGEPVDPCAGGGPRVGCEENAENGTGLRATEPVTQSTLDRLNPLIRLTNEENAQELSTPGGIVSRFLTRFAFPLAGIILFVMVLWGGAEMLMGAVDKKSIDAGKQRVTAAVMGFLLLFVAYWIARVMELVFGIQIL